MELDKATLVEVHSQLMALLTRSRQDRESNAAMARQATDPDIAETLKDKSQRAGWQRSGLDLATDLVMDLIAHAK